MACGADKFHPLRMAIVMLVAYAAMIVAAFFLVRDASTFSVARVLHGVIAGCFLTSQLCCSRDWVGLLRSNRRP